LSLNTGNGSIHKSKKDKGFGFGIGLENSVNFVNYDEVKEWGYIILTMIPTLKFSFRKWYRLIKTGRSKLSDEYIFQERILKIGLGSEYKNISDDDSRFYELNDEYNIKLLRSLYISYSFNILPNY
jgi:hypothetical protein